jgi:uncharacterized membrane protein
MNKKNIQNIIKLYGLMGKFLCACAGGVLGFIIGGPFVAVLGAIVGTVSGHLFEKSMVSA